MSQTLASSPLIQSAFSLPYCITASPSKRKQKGEIRKRKENQNGGRKEPKGGKKERRDDEGIISVSATTKNTVLLLSEQALLCFSSSPTTPYCSSHSLVNNCLSISAAHTNFMLSDIHLLQEHVNDISCISHVYTST